MKIRVLLLTLLMVCKMPQAEAFFDYFSDLIKDHAYITTLFKMKETIMPQLADELLTPEEKKNFLLKLDKVVSSDEGRIKRLYKRTRMFGEREVDEIVRAQIFHAPLKEKPYSSIYDWRKRWDHEIALHELSDFKGRKIKTEIISSNDREMIYEFTQYNPRDEYPGCHSIGRAVLHGKRVYLVEYAFFYFKLSDEDKKMWIDRFSKNTFLNKLARSEDSPSGAQQSQNK